MVVMEQHPSSGTHSSARNVSNTAASVNQVNPHSLGREFVRQYYTLLNRSPENLHRFYAEDSSLVHGTPGKTDEHLEPVYGSEEIKERILSLNYKDCHAKIRQVDALETLQKGVVVQVTGELSSDGQPMRRFLQTFVLAPQSPTNYYVRNDIFRYLDEVFMEEEEGSETERVEVEAPKPTQSVSQSSLANNTVGLTSHSAPTQVLAAPSAPILESPKQINGHPESKSSTSEPESPPATTSSVTAPVVPEPIVSKPVVPAEPPKPLSWASRVADNVPVAPVVPVVQKSVQSQELPPPSSVTGATSPAATKVSPGKEGVKAKAGQTPRGKKFDREAPVSLEGEVGGDEKKAVVTTTYGDEQQVFVGNLPQDISEEELKSFFSKYGAIADVRINRQNQKNGAGRTPNYGFVTFEDAKVVKVLLSQKPIYFNEHRFNVEEKRSQGRGPPGNFFGGRGGNNTGRGFPAKAREEGRRQRGSFGDRDSRPSEGTPAGGGGRRHASSSGGPGPGGPPRGGPPPVKR